MSFHQEKQLPRNVLAMLDSMKIASAKNSSAIISDRFKEVQRKKTYCSGNVLHFTIKYPSFSFIG